MFNTVTIYYIIKKRRVVERETAGARWWAVRFVTDREGRLEVGQPLKVCGPGVWAVVSVKGPTFSGPW